MLDKILTRFPGGINAIGFNLAIKNLLLRKFDNISDRESIRCYFLGGERSMKLLYDQLVTLYSEGNHFNFNGIRLPKVSTSAEQTVFAFEFLDFFYPYLSGRMDHFVEGPYLYSKIQIASKDIVIDAGANVGMFSALASKLGGIVYAFEPVEEIRQKYLTQTAQLNPNIHIIPLALSDKTGEIIIAVDKNNLGGSSICMKRKNSNEEAISAITLDEWAKQNNISKIDFIKADIEGAERLMLVGAQYVLKTYTPKLAICTYHLPDDKKVLTDLILKTNPNYKIEYRWKKLYASI